MHTHHVVSLQKTVLVTGASGLLGRDIAKAFDRAAWRVVGTALNRTNPPDIVKLDLLDPDSFPVLLDDVKPDAIVHCAANRFPDLVEANPESAHATNVVATHHLAKEASTRNIFFIYISSDYVFSGAKGEAPYKANDPVSPPNKYGQTKADGEKAMLDVMGTDSVGGRTLGVVLRVPLLYGHCEDDEVNKSAVHVIVDAVRRAREVKVDVDDWSVRFPTSTEDCGRVTKDIAELYMKAPGKTGDSAKKLPSILQFSAKDRYTKFEMAKFFAEDCLGISMENVNASSPEDDQITSGSVVNRPYDTQLDTAELEKLDIDVTTLDFEGWWRRELRAFRH